MKNIDEIMKSQKIQAAVIAVRNMKSLLMREYNIDEEFAEDVIEIASTFNIHSEQEFFEEFAPIVVATLKYERGLD